MKERLKNWFFQLSRKNQIIVCVIGAHLFFLLFLSVDYLFHSHSNKRKNVIVHTVQITPPKKSLPQKTAAPTQKKASTPPAAKKPTAKQVPKQAKAPASPKKETAVSEPSITNTKLLQEIEESFEAIASPTPTKTAQTTIHIPTLSTPSSSQITNELSTEEIVATFLREVLTLPELGEVKAVLSIDREGHLQSIDILFAKSEKNAIFLKNRLPQLQFPCLNEEASITVLFSNAL